MTTAARSHTEVVQVSDAKFARVRWADFLTGEQLPVNLYMKLDKNRYGLTFLAQERLEKARLMLQDPSEAPWLYFLAQERTLLMKQLSAELLNVIGGVRPRSAHESLALLGEFAHQYHEAVVASGIGAATMPEGRLMAEGISHLLKNERELVQLMLGLESDELHRLCPAFLTAFLSGLIVSRMSWGTRTTLEHTALGGLLCDIGLLRLPLNLRQKKSYQLDEKETQMWQEHPRLGVEMLDESTWIPESIKQIVYQHHELMNGKGFPGQLTGYYIYPMAKVVGFAQAFAEFLLSHQLSALEGIRIFLRRPEVVERYDQQVIRTFLGCFVYKAPKQRREGGV